MIAAGSIGRAGGPGEGVGVGSGVGMGAHSLVLAREFASATPTDDEEVGLEGAPRSPGGRRPHRGLMASGSS